MTRQASLFELATELVRIHEQSAPGRVSVVPVLVDDLELMLPVIEALATVMNGRVLDAAADELQGPVPGTADVVRRTAIETALTTVPRGGTRRVTLEAVASDRLDATFADPPLGADPSQGEKTVLAVARAASHADLDRYEFAVIAFRDLAVDLPFRTAIWSLIVDQLSDAPNSTLRTLVVVAESSIDIGLHCQTGRGFRFAVDGDRLLRRRGRDDLNAVASSIAQHNDPFVVFLGAGFSASSRLPLGNGLRDSAIRRLLNIEPAELHTSVELARRFHAWIALRPGWLTDSEAAMREDEYARQLTLEQVIRAEQRFYSDLPTLAEFRDHHDAVIGTPGSAVTDLSAVIAGAVGRAILVEVNFDRLVEAHSAVPLRTFFSDADFESAPEYVERYLNGSETDVPLLKLHGDIYEPATCVVSQEQTERGVGAGKLESLRSLISDPPRLWIYVGTSMRDKDLLPVLRGEDFARGLDERWVNPYLLDTIETFAVERLPFWSDKQLRSTNDRIVTETADAFFAAWRNAL
jgi:hypothetical protein